MKKDVKTFYDLETWQKAHSFVLEIYQQTQTFSSEEKFGLISQLRRSSVSITANIAEGFGRYHFKDKMKFYYQSRGSLFEVQNFLILSKDLELITNERYQDLKTKSEEIGRLLNGLLQTIGKRLIPLSSPQLPYS